MKKKVILILIPIILVLAVGAGFFFYFDKKGKEAEAKGGKNGRMQFWGSGQFSSGSYGNLNLQDMVTASGVTNMGTVSETFDVTELDTELQIEKVYVASGDELKAGDKVLKLSDDSVAAARKELQEKERDAELACRTGAIEYERSKIAAEYDRDSTKLSGSQAEAVYQDSLLDISSDVETTQTKLNETTEQISEYSSYVDNGSYREYFKVDEYQKLYDENLKILTDLMDEWGITWAQVTGQGGGVFSGSGAGGSSEYSQWVTILKNLYSILEQNRKDLDNALANYEDALVSASVDKKLLENSLSELQESLAKAKASYEKAVLQNQLTKEKSLSNANRADRDYETALEKAESDYETLKSAWEDAKKNLEIFEEQVGDGYFYASADGNVLRSSVRAGNTLRADSTVFIYSDPSAMTVTVSVDQSNIAKVTPGETAVVMSQKGTTMEGTVKSVNPVSTSESRNNVTYNVTVELNGAGELKSNESVTVIFGMTADEITGGRKQSTEDQNGSDGKTDGERPGGMPGNWSGEMPEGMPGDWSGEMPEGMPGDWNGERPGRSSGDKKGSRPDGTNGENSGKDAQ